MSSVLAGQTDRLQGRIVRAAEGPVIFLLLFAVAFFLPDLGDGHRIHASLHIFFLAGGSLAAIFSSLFWMLIQHEEHTDRRVVLFVSALLGMGILDGFYAGYLGIPLHALQILHTLALLVGGITLALVALPDRMLSRRKFRFFPQVMGGGCLAVGMFFLFFFRTIVPIQEMKSGLGLRSFILSLTAVGGISFLIAWMYFLYTPQSGFFEKNRLVANGSFLFVMAAFLSAFSSRWGLLWWFGHLVLFLAYLFCSCFLLAFSRNQVKKCQENSRGPQGQCEADSVVNNEKKMSVPSRFPLACCGQGNCGGGYIRTDSTDRKDLEYQLQLDQKILERAEEAIVVTDANAAIIDINKAYTCITGYEPREIIGENPRICKSGYHDQAFYKAMWKELLETGKWSGEIWDRRKSGEVYQKWLTINAIYDNTGETINYLGIFTDITEKRRVERQLKKLLFYDSLTNLPNRTLFEELLAQALQNSQFHDEPLVLLCIDLHRFKDINDTLGYKAGDELLIQVSKRIRSCVRETDTVSRLYGDEFMVLLSEIKLKESVGHLARHLLHVLQQPFHLGGEEVFVDASIGISVYPEDGQDAESLVRNADTAMNFARKRGQGNYQYFRAQMNENLVHRVTVERELRHALEHEEFILYYQPKYNLATGKMAGVEALMRWRHPIKGIISPAEFIPVAEESSLILALGEWGLREACRQVKVWQEQGLGGLLMATNLSSKQFQDKQMLSFVIEALDKNGMKPESLELEITESVLMENPDAAAKLLRDIRGLGVRIAIDDFGTGYSSLAYLKKFPVNTLKIDQAFITDIVHDNNDGAIVGSILSMAKNLNLKVVAEGVETKGQLELLRKMGCEEVQGYYFSKPLPPEGVAELLTLGDFNK